VLVKELQGLGLKVDLLHSNRAVDAEKLLSSNIRKEAAEEPTVDMPVEAASDIDVTENVLGEEFEIVTDDSDLGGPAATVAMTDDFATDDPAAIPQDEGEEV